MNGSFLSSFLISIPISLGGAILGKRDHAARFGAAYIAGGTAFSILMLTLSFDYAGFVISNAIFAYDHQKSLIVSSVIGGLGNVLFDLLLIPHWGMAGSAVATLMASILSNAYLWYAMKKLNRFSVLPRIRKIFVAGAVHGGRNRAPSCRAHEHHSKYRDLRCRLLCNPLLLQRTPAPRDERGHRPQHIRSVKLQLIFLV